MPPGNAYLRVRRPSFFHIRVGALIGLDQMVAMHRRGHGGFIAPGLHELEQRHLSRRVLHRHTIGTQKQVGVAGMQLLISWIIKMPEQNFLCVGKRSIESLANNVQVGIDLCVGVLDEFGRGLDNGHVVLPAEFKGMREHLSAGA